MILQHEKKEQAVIAPDLSQMTELGRQRFASLFLVIYDSIIGS